MSLFGDRAAIPPSTGRNVTGIRAFTAAGARTQVLASVDLSFGAVDARFLSIVVGIRAGIVVMRRIVIVDVSGVIAGLRIVVARVQTHKHQG